MYRLLSYVYVPGEILKEHEKVFSRCILEP